MTQIIRTPTLGRIFCSLFLLTALFLIGGATSAKAQRRSAKSKSSSSRASKKSSAKKQTASRSTRNNKRGATAKNSRSSRREVARNGNRGGRQVSRRDMRRLSPRRRRELLAAARRAEAARQAALARQRAFDQGLKDETAANILRDSTTGEDMEIRQIAVNALGNHAGSVVVMDPKSGRVYTVVNQEWALRRGYKPCSTIKLVTGVAGLCENIIDPLTEVSGRGVDLTASLAYSDNPFFQSVGGRVGFERIISYARDLGLGERTGVNYVNESAGRVPLFKSGYAVNHMCSHGDDFEVTPVQLATMVSAIANGGSLLTPHVPRTPEETVRFKTEVRRKINVPKETLQRMVPGMIGAVNYGTAKLAYDPMQTVAGKTGTCIGQGSWLGLFASYAPVMEPKLAVVVVTRGSGERGRVAAGIAGKIYRALNGRFGTPTNMRYATAPEVLAPRPNIDPRGAIVSDELEADEAERDGVDPSNEADTSTDSRGTVKTVIKPVPSKTNDARATPAVTVPSKTNETRATPAVPVPTKTNDSRTTTAVPSKTTDARVTSAVPAPSPKQDAQRPRRVGNGQP